MRISVIFPIYKPEVKKLLQSVEGVINQKVEGVEFEYWVVNDSGLDYSVKDVLCALDSLCFDYKYHSNPETFGLARCWNTAVQLTTFEYVHIVHQDDIVHDGFYEVIYRMYLEKKCSFYGTRSNYINDNDLVISVSPIIGNSKIACLLHADLFYNTPIQCVSTVYFKEAFYEVGGFDQRYCFLLDRRLLLSLISHGCNLVSNEILSSYRLSDNNETSRLEKNVSIFNDFKMYLDDLINGNYDVQKRRYDQKVYEWALAVHAKYNASCKFGVADDFYSNMNNYFSYTYLMRKKLKSKLSTLISKM